MDDFEQMPQGQWVEQDGWVPGSDVIVPMAYCVRTVKRLSAEGMDDMVLISLLVDCGHCDARHELIFELTPEHAVNMGNDLIESWDRHRVDLGELPARPVRRSWWARMWGSQA